MEETKSSDATAAQRAAKFAFLHAERLEGVTAPDTTVAPDRVTDWINSVKLAKSHSPEEIRTMALNGVREAIHSAIYNEWHDGDDQTRQALDKGEHPLCEALRKHPDLDRYIHDPETLTDEELNILAQKGNRDARYHYAFRLWKNNDGEGFFENLLINAKNAHTQSADELGRFYEHFATTPGLTPQLEQNLLLNAIYWKCVALSTATISFRAGIRRPDDTSHDLNASLVSHCRSIANTAFKLGEIAYPASMR